MPTVTMPRPDARRRLVVAVATFLLISIFVVRTSDAAFTATHTNDGNAFATATIDLDGAPTVPLFGDGVTSVVDATNLHPGTAVDACIDIVYTGSLDADDLDAVVLTVTGATGSLADELELTVDVLDDDCSGGSPDNTIVSGAIISGVGPTGSGWTPATDGDTRGFVFTVEVTDDADQDDTLGGVGLIWSLETTS